MYYCTLYYLLGDLLIATLRQFPLSLYTRIVSSVCTVYVLNCSTIYLEISSVLPYGSSPSLCTQGQLLGTVFVLYVCNIVLYTTVLCTTVLCTTVLLYYLLEGLLSAPLRQFSLSLYTRIVSTVFVQYMYYILLCIIYLKFSSLLPSGSSPQPVHKDSK